MEDESEKPKKPRVVLICGHIEIGKSAMLQAAILSAQKSHDIIVIENHKDFPEEPELPEPPPYLFKMVIPHDYKKEINGRDNIPVPVKYKRNRFRK